jgi:ribosome-binding ATPase YchF (GTP1/OBG family)
MNTRLSNFPIKFTSGSKNIVPGLRKLLKNANKGEGLGNQFLANIREVDAIIHVLRCFENSDIIHVEGSVDPIRDAEIVNTELMIADLNSLEIRMANLEKKSIIPTIAKTLISVFFHFYRDHFYVSS